MSGAAQLARCDASIAASDPVVDQAAVLVGAFRQIDIAAAFVISDLLSDERWHAQFHDAVEPLQRLYAATLDVLSAVG
jgi:hypothetical protein